MLWPNVVRSIRAAPGIPVWRDDLHRQPQPINLQSKKTLSKNLYESGDAWSRTTLLKNQLQSFAKLLFALYPCRAWHPRLSRRPSQAASTF